MRPTLLLALLLVLTQPAYSQEWTRLPTSNPNVLFAIDLGSIERDGDIAMFRERLTYDIPDKVDEASGMLIREKLVHRVMDCKNKTQGMLSGTMRSESGSLIERVTFDRNQLVMAPIPAGSLAEKELDVVCSQAKKAPPS
jgi:hypothetical protein